MWPYSCECGFRFKSFNALNRHKLNQCKLTLAQLDPPKDSRSMSLTTTMAVTSRTTRLSSATGTTSANTRLPSVSKETQAT